MRYLILLVLILFAACQAPKRAPDKEVKIPDKYGKCSQEIHMFDQLSKTGQLQKAIQELEKCPDELPALFLQEEIMQRNYDKFTDATWFTISKRFKYFRSPLENFSLVFFRTNNMCELRIVYSYFGSNWLFMDRATLFSEPNNRYFVSFINPYRKVVQNGIYEEYNITAIGEHLQFIENAIQSKSLDIRLSGDTYHHDVSLGANDLALLGFILKEQSKFCQ